MELGVLFCGFLLLYGLLLCCAGYLLPGLLTRGRA
jgi:hypothetical protein